MSSPQQRTTLDDALGSLRAFVRDNYPGDAPVRVVLTLRSGEEIRLPFPAPPAGTCTHSLDFASIVWFGKPYRGFSPVQAAIIKALWEAWEADCPEVGGGALLAEAESVGRKMSDIFGDHPIWHDGVLGRAGKSAYRLYEPEGE